jgi:diguanylate cyclase (GGDEF)-like protein
VGLLERPVPRLVVVCALLAAAAAILVRTDSQGLVTVLVLLAACATATWVGRWAGAAVAAVSGAGFFVWNLKDERLTGLSGVGFTVVAVCMWVFLAWAAGVTAGERRRMDALLAHRALHDPLTGLANRILLLDRIEQALRRGERRRSPVAVLFVDLDGFKSVNDTMGHAAGDALLAELGRRFAERLRASDTAARIGGDEFAFVCEDLHDEEQVKGIVDRLLKALEQPFHHQGREVPIRASVGVAVTSSFTQSAEQLLTEADKAMYRMKRGRASSSPGEDRAVDVPRPRDPRERPGQAGDRTPSSRPPR